MIVILACRASAIHAEDHRRTLVVPCSPMTVPSAELGATPKWRARWVRKRRLSGNVPATNTRRVSSMSAGEIGERVWSVCNDNDDRIRRSGHDIGNEILVDFCIGREKLLPSISFRSVAPPILSLMPAVIRMTEQPVKSEKSARRTAVVCISLFPKRFRFVAAAADEWRPCWQPTRPDRASRGRMRRFRAKKHFARSCASISTFPTERAERLYEWSS